MAEHTLAMVVVTAEKGAEAGHHIQLDQAAAALGDIQEMAEMVPLPIRQTQLLALAVVQEAVAAAEPITTTQAAAAAA